MASPQVSYCKSELMSVCTACDKKQQMKCLFYRKASLDDRCMHHVFDEYCDSLDAQKQAQQNQATCH